MLNEFIYQQKAACVGQKNVKQHDILFISPCWGFSSSDLKSVFDFYIEFSFHAVYVMDSDR